MLTLTRQRGPARVLIGDQADRLLDHPRVDHGNQSQALGDRQERARRQRPILVVEHPQQQLVLGDASSICQIDDRLAVQREAVLVDRVAEPLELAEPPGCLVLAGHGDGVLDEGVAARSLCLVHREVGARQHLRGGGAVEHGNAHAGRHRRQLLAERHLALACGLDDGVGHERCALGVDVPKEHAELVASEAGDDVGVAHASLEHACRWS